MINLEMNKNEKNQLELLKRIVFNSEKDKLDLFYGCLSIEKFGEPYDAVAIFSDHKKHIQIITMSNLVMGKGNEIQHANKHGLELKPNFTDKHIKENKNYLKNNLNVERHIVRQEEKSLHVLDQILHVMPEEENFDSKYQVNTVGLINATYRAISKKMNKYNLDNKKDKSILVIIDESLNFFGNGLNKKIVNFKGFSEKKKLEIQKWNIQEYFKSILFTAIAESHFDADNFFNKVQVYYRNCVRSFASDNDSIMVGSRYYAINNKMKKNFPMNHIAHEQVFPRSMHTIHKAIKIVDIND